MTPARIAILLADDSLIVGEGAKALLGMAADIESTPDFWVRITGNLPATQAA